MRDNRWRGVRARPKSRQAQDWATIAPEPSPAQLSFRSKQDELDAFAGAAVRYLVDWLRDDGELLVTFACGRQVEGHYRYGDRLMYEYDQAELEAEAAEELADAILYVARLLVLRSRSYGRT